MQGSSQSSFLVLDPLILTHKQSLWDANLQVMRVCNKLQELKLALYFNSQRLTFGLIYHTAEQTITAKLACRGGHLDVLEMTPI